jgi:hypothetical protein
MGAAVARHDELAREIVDRHGGYVQAPGSLLGTIIVDNNGDPADSSAGLATFTVEYSDASFGVDQAKARARHEPVPAAAKRRTLTVNTRWRAGIEARVSTLKRDHGWDRTRMANHDGTRTWLGFGVFAHNTRKLARLL